jgi:prepilin-type N-terminal cleavage/methylation domain-containing protein
MRTTNKQAGFSVIEVLVVVIIVGLLGALGAIGYKAYTHQTNKSSVSSAPASPVVASTQAPLATDVSTAPAIASSTDLGSAMTTLDHNDPSTTNTDDSSQLDDQASF